MPTFFQEKEEMDMLKLILEADPKRFRNNCMSHFSVLRESDPSSMKKIA